MNKKGFTLVEVLSVLVILSLLLILTIPSIKNALTNGKNKINEIKNVLEKCLEDNECFGDVFNELIDRIIVHKQSDKKIKLDIYIKTGESLYTTSDNLGKKFHLLDSYTTSNRSISHTKWRNPI